MMIPSSYSSFSRGISIYLNGDGFMAFPVPSHHSTTQPYSTTAIVNHTALLFLNSRAFCGIREPRRKNNKNACQAQPLLVLLAGWEQWRAAPTSQPTRDSLPMFSEGNPEIFLNVTLHYYSPQHCT